MRKYILFMLLLLPLTANAWWGDDCCDTGCRDFDLKFRVGFLNPHDKQVRKHFNHWITDYELEAGIPFWCDWQAWTNVGYWSKKGRNHHSDFSSSSSSFEYKRINHWNIDFGVKRYFNNDCWCLIPDSFHPYLGLGIGAVHANLKHHDRSGSHSSSSSSKNSKWGFDLVFKSGIEIDVCDCIFADLFLDYNYEWFKFKKNNGSHSHKKTTDLGGLKLGVGLGYHF